VPAAVTAPVAGGAGGAGAIVTAVACEMAGAGGAAGGKSVVSRGARTSATALATTAAAGDGGMAGATTGAAGAAGGAGVGGGADDGVDDASAAARMMACVARDERPGICGICATSIMSSPSMASPVFGGRNEASVEPVAVAAAEAFHVRPTARPTISATSSSPPSTPSAILVCRFILPVHGGSTLFHSAPRAVENFNHIHLPAPMEHDTEPAVEATSHATSNGTSTNSTDCTDCTAILSPSTDSDAAANTARPAATEPAAVPSTNAAIKGVYDASLLEALEDRISNIGSYMVPGRLPSRRVHLIAAKMAAPAVVAAGIVHHLPDFVVLMLALFVVAAPRLLVALALAAVLASAVAMYMRLLYVYKKLVLTAMAQLVEAVGSEIANGDWVSAEELEERIKSVSVPPDLIELCRLV